MPNPAIAGAGKLLEAIALLDSLLSFGERFSKHGSEIRKLVLLLEQSSLVEQAQKIDTIREKIQKLEEEIKKEEKELATLPQANDVGGSDLLASGEIRRAQQESVIQAKKSELQEFEKELQNLQNEFQKGLDKVSIEAEKKRVQIEYETERARLKRTIKDENQLRLALLDIDRDYLQKKVDQEYGQVRELGETVKDLKLAIDKQYEEQLSDLRHKVEAERIQKEIEERSRRQVLDRASNPNKLTTNTPQSLFGGVELGKPKLSKVSTKGPSEAQEEPKKQFQELSKESQAFISAFDSGMQAVGQSINQSVGGMFKSVFGEANSLLEIFIQNFISSMASNVLSLLSGGATSWLSGILRLEHGGIINEPIFGIGKSGQRYLFGEAGSEAIIPLSRIAAEQAVRMNSTAMIKPTVVVTPLISSKGLAVQVEVGNRMNTRSRV